MQYKKLHTLKMGAGCIEGKLNAQLKNILGNSTVKKSP